MAIIGRVELSDPKYVNDSTYVIVEATEEGNGVRMTLSVVNENNQLKTGWADLRGLFFDVNGDQGVNLQVDQDKDYQFDLYPSVTPSVTSTVAGSEVTEVQAGEGLVVDLGNGATMSGIGTFDAGIEIGTGGLKDGGTPDDFATSTFTISNLSLDDLYGNEFGIRLMSVANGSKDGDGNLLREGSEKLVGRFEKPDDPACEFGGYSRGSWLNGARSSGLVDALVDGGLASSKEDALKITFGKLIFGIDTGLEFISKEGGISTTYDNPTLIQALGLNGGGNNQLAAQATAAFLNALYLEQDGDPLTCYRVDTDQIKEWTAEALKGNSVDLSKYSWYVESNGTLGFQADEAVSGSASSTANDLKNLFDFNNNLSEMSTPLSNPMLTNPLVGI